jgi:hypothetical protein
MAVSCSSEKQMRRETYQVTRRLRLVLAVTGWMVVTLVGCGEDPLAPSSGGSGGESTGQATSGGFESPEAVFEAEKKAQADKDWGTQFDIFTPGSQDDLVGMMAYGASAFGGMTGKGDEAKAILKKYGVDESMLPEKPSMANMANMEAMMKKVEEAKAKVSAAIKDKRAFFVEMAAFMDNATSESGASGQMQKAMENAKKAQAAAKLVDVEISGNSAVGKREIVNNGTPMKVPVYFEKIDGSWLMRQPTPEEAKKMGEEIGRAVRERMERDAAQ